MKIQDVPQDQDPTYEGRTKICYAIAADGKFTQVETTGWNVEADAKNLAWKSINDDLEVCRQRVVRDEASSLEYFMKFRQMDVKLLANNMGISAWRVKWHLRPTRFRKLSDKWLQRYAACLDVPVTRLHEFNGELK